MNSTHSEITQSEEAFIKKTVLDGNGQTDMTDCWGLNGTWLNDADAYMQGSRVSMVTRDTDDPKLRRIPRTDAAVFLPLFIIMYCQQM